MKTALIMTLALAPAAAAAHGGAAAGLSHFTAAGRECSLGFCAPAATAPLRSDCAGSSCGARGTATGPSWLSGGQRKNDGGLRPGRVAGPSARSFNGAGGLRASSVVEGESGLEAVLRGVPAVDGGLDGVAPASLPFLGNTNDEDALLNGGVKVGHGIRFSTYPKQVVSAGHKSLSEVVAQLHDAGRRTLTGSEEPSQLDFTFRQIFEVREEVSTYHSLSERKLSSLGRMLTERFSGGEYETTSVVTARSQATDGGLEQMGADHFTLTQSLSKEEDLKSAGGGEYGVDGYQLASRQLSEMSVEGLQPVMVDHTLEYQAEEWNEWGVHRVIAHSRPRHDLWKVIADSLFGIDHLLPHGGVTDMYHLKIVVEDEEHAEAMQRFLRKVEWTDAELFALGLPVQTDTRSASLIEETTHTASDLGHMVAVGEGASGGDRSSTISWWDAHFQVRVQTLNEHYAETEMISMANRERLAVCKELEQQRLAVQTPLYGFARSVMEWMLTSDSTSGISSPPSCDTIKVSIS